jgi:predicted Zn-dependent protease
MRWRELAVGVTAGGAAIGVGCSDPAAPDRSFAYSFADTIIVAGDTSIDLFRWPDNRLPVRFWADPRGNMAFLVERAVRAWEDQFLYGEFRGDLVTDSTRADVIVRWTDSVPPDVLPDSTLPNSCGGLTTFDYDTTGFTLSGPIHVSLSVLSGPASAARVQGCMRRLAIHELGHALGLLRHSPFPDDIMYGSPAVNYPSRFDRRSIETLYHSSPTVAPPPR